MDPEVPVDELPPFTADQARALGECRFVTVALDHSWMLALTTDRAVVDAVGLRGLPYGRQQWSDPSDTEYEIRSSHPDAVAAAVKIMERRAA